LRRVYLDWLRGIAVLIMIEGHARDAWTRVDDRGSSLYQWQTVLTGFGAPIFLFLAGVSIALAAGSRLRKGLDRSGAGRAAVRRGLTIFGLAFLFRLQSWIISGGAFPQSLLKVDILNVMGVAMVAAALLWWLGGNVRSRIAIFAAATVAAAMATPIVRATTTLAVLPDSIELYLRPFDGRATFTLLPWGAFLLAGAAVGVWLDAARDARAERRVNLALAAIGTTVAIGAYAASYLPPLYDTVSFWTTSPAFFFLRLGILIAAVPVACALTSVVRAPRLEEFGRASLFVYWIHVEMAYGILSLPLHRRLTHGQSLIAFALFTVLLFALVRLKARVVAPNTKIGQSTQIGRAIEPPRHI
jgi:uncharacterized membrane protein